MVNLIVEQERAGSIEPLYGKQLYPLHSSAADKHFLSTPENKRLNGNENFVEKLLLQHKAIHSSAAEHGNALVSFEQVREVHPCWIDKSNRPATRESFRATRKNESISFA